MRRKLLSVGLVFLILFAFKIPFVASAERKGFSGVLYFRDGSAVEFNHIGGLENIDPCEIWGKLKSQDVILNCYEIKEIHFADTNKRYDTDDRGDLIIVNRQGQKFTLQEGYFWADGSWHKGGKFHFTYNDPITNSVKKSPAKIHNKISHIIIEEHIGTLKCNPSNKQYFPAVYNYDPFTGEKLQWATHR